MMCHAGFGGVDRETSEYYCFLETFGGGYGGRFASDGPDAVQTHGQNTENAPVEETELNYPVRVARLSLVEDSEGPGRFRGGLGLRKDFLFDRPTTFTVLADRTLAGPAGAFGGLDGKPAEYVLVRGGEETRLGAKTTIELEAGDVGQLPHLRRRRLRAAGGARPRARRARRARGKGQRRAGAGGVRVAAVDPITFEVIRNALVAATDEMALALKRSAYSTNIKTRSDFSCAFFDAQLRSVAQGFAQPVHLGSMVEQVPQAVRDVRRREPRRRRRARHERPPPERRPPERRQPDLARPPRGRAARLRREPRPPRRRRRRRARLDRRVPGGVPGGRDHPAGQARRGRRDRGRRLQARSSPRSARSTRPPATCAPRSRRTRPACAACRRSSSGTAATRSWRRWTSCSTTPSGARAPSSPRCRAGVYEAEGFVDNDGYTDEPVRLQARVEIDAGRRPLRPDRLRPAAARAGQLDLRDDVLRLRLRAQVPDRPRPAGQRRLLPARQR